MTGESAPFHLLSAASAVARLGANPAAGLAEAEAQARLGRLGPNKLAEKPPRSKWLLFLDQFKNLLIVVLIGAALLAGAIGELKDAVVILVVVVANALLGFYQEYRAEATLAALKKMLAQTARVRRGGKVMEIAAQALVPGDLVLLEAGDRVPADGRVLAAHNAEVAEAVLTGESHPVGKHTDALPAGEHPLAERFNMAYMNTVVTRGRLELLVSATGMQTEMGRITGMLEEAEVGPTPLQVQLDLLGKRLALIAGAVVTLIFALGMLRDQPLVQTILTSIALAVAAIPEGLPAVVTVTLALGMHRMAKNRAIVKKLAAVETLGCTTVICSDKTGTLTLNQMTARALYFRARHFGVSGEGYSGAGAIAALDGRPLPDFAPLLLPAALCNESRLRDGELIGDPTEGALLALAVKGGVEQETAAERWPRIGEVPFDSAHKFMATFHHDGEWVRVYLKGAPDVLLARSARFLAAEGETAGAPSLARGPADVQDARMPRRPGMAESGLGPIGEAPLTDAARAAFSAENERLAAQAMRVLAVASRTLRAAEFAPDADPMGYAQDLTFIGLAGIIDPPRPEARDAIALCRRAGIQVKMITGDHKVTAAAIARALGLDGEALEGRELDAIEPARLPARIEAASVFARVTPEHKVKIVQALKARGHVVAMTGDGVNDAPALKHADIGVAMGIAGTEVTREAATMVLTDDNFATIVGAVEEGRTIYDNIVKFVRFQLSTNIGAILTVLGAQLAGLPMPFTAIQILWINIIMDGPPAMTLGVEPSRPGIMHEPPRPAAARILTLARLAHLFGYGATMAAGTLGVFYYGRTTGGMEHALTLAFTTFVLFQFFNVFNARTEHGTAFNRHFFANGKLWSALGAVVALQVLVVHWGPAQAVFHTTALTAAGWWLAFGVASSVLLLDEARKLVTRLTRAGRRA